MAKVIVTLPAAATTLGRDRTGAGTVAVAVAGARSRGYYQAVGRVQSRQAGRRREGRGGGVGFERCARHAPTATHFLSDLNRCSGPYQIKNRADFLCCRVSPPPPSPAPSCIPLSPHQHPQPEFGCPFRVQNISVLSFFFSSFFLRSVPDQDAASWPLCFVRSFAAFCFIFTLFFSAFLAFFLLFLCFFFALGLQRCF